MVVTLPFFQISFFRFCHLGELEDINIELGEGVSEVRHGQIWEKKKVFSKLSQLYDLSSRGGAFSAPSLFFDCFTPQ
jgi:hypothetical protein